MCISHVGCSFSNLALFLCNTNSSGAIFTSFIHIVFTFLDSYIFDVQCGIWKAFKRAAESLEKLMDVTREELPDTMAAVRLSGMEISDLTMELSDIGLVS